MHFGRLCTRGLHAILPLAFLVACDSAATQPFFGAGQSVTNVRSGVVELSPRVSQLRGASRLLYVGSVNGTIDTFSLVNGQYQKTAQIADSNGPEGLHTDAAANLYVADQGIGSEGPGVGDIAVYPKGASQPSRFIVPGYNVSDVIHVKNGGLYASNFGPDGQFGPGSLSYYGASGSSPVRTMTIHNSFQALSVVADRASKAVFVSYSDNSNTGHIARFDRGRGPAHDLGVSFGTPWGLAEDGSGNLLVADGQGPIRIYSQQGQALGTISVPGTPYRMAFNADRSLLYVTNFGNFDVEIFSYPGAKMVGTIHSSDWGKNAWTDGIAAWPPPQ
ncbi:MAG: hypothetical protein JOZ01_07690 [Candidatus Eremiobacteraeota bacterium]|nr:hypothetical protein [Candidatus Eremiobacteraeota bacterium]